MDSNKTHQNHNRVTYFIIFKQINSCPKQNPKQNRLQDCSLMTRTGKTVRPSVLIGSTTCGVTGRKLLYNQRVRKHLLHRCAVKQLITQKDKPEPNNPPRKAYIIVSLSLEQTLMNYTHTGIKVQSCYTATSMERMKKKHVIWALLT